MSDHAVKTLSIRNPWAWAVLHAGKSVENRSWTCRHRGELLIHAGLRPDPDGFEFLAELGIQVPARLPAGGIIGQVQLVDVVTDSDSEWAIPGQFHWLLASPEPVEFRPCRGQLGLFEAGGA